MKPVRPSDLAPAVIPRGPLISRRSLVLGGLGAAALSGAAVAGYAGVEAAAMLDVTRYKLTPPNWPAGQRLTISVNPDRPADRQLMADLYRHGRVLNQRTVRGRISIEAEVPRRLLGRFSPRGR